MIKLSKASLVQDIQDGLKVDAICEKYSTEDTKLKKSELQRILKQAGLKIRKFSVPKYMLVDDVKLPLDPTVAIETKVEAEKGNQQFDAALTETTTN